MINTPYFPGLKAIFAPMGKRVAERTQDAARSLDGLSGLFAPFMPALVWERAKSGAGTRIRLDGRTAIFFAFLAQVLQRGSSARFAVALLQANRVSRGLKKGSDATGGYCAARAALSLQWLQQIFYGVSAWFDRRSSDATLWRGRQVRILDGTGFSMPDTEANRHSYPFPSGTKPGCGFPAGKMAGLFCLHTGRLLRFVYSGWKKHDLNMGRQLLKYLKRGDILVADRAYGSWLFLMLLRLIGVDFVIRMHQGRRVSRRRIGSWLETWKKPQKPKGENAKMWSKLPEEQSVRIVAYRVRRNGFRPHLVYLVTSLTINEFPNDTIEELYGLRWQIELHFRQIKTTLGLDVLRCLSPDMIEKELWMHAIAYNLVRALMMEAAQSSNVPIEQISFKGTVDTLLQWKHLWRGKRPRCIRHIRSELLARIAGDQVIERPGRSEPRAKKRRPKNYQWLTKPRNIFHVSPSRSKK
jgi:hypothetical protein